MMGYRIFNCLQLDLEYNDHLSKHRPLFLHTYPIGGSWVFSGICINSSHIKAFSTLSCKYCKITLSDSFTIYSSLCLFLLQIKSVTLHFWSPWCSLGWYRNFHKSSSGNTFLSRYFSDLSSSIISGFIASFDFMSINQWFCAVHLVYNATQFINSNYQYFFKV